MSLSEFYESVSPRLKYRPTPCKVCVWYAALDSKGMAFFDEALGGNVTKLWMACLAFDPDADFCLTTIRRHKQICLTCR